MKKRVAGTNYFAIVRFIILAFIIISIMRFCTSGTNQHRCVQLKIGLDLGYNAVFDFSQPYWRPMLFSSLVMEPRSSINLCGMCISQIRAFMAPLLVNQKAGHFVMFGAQTPIGERKYGLENLSTTC